MVASTPAAAAGPPAMTLARAIVTTKNAVASQEYARARHVMCRRRTPTRYRCATSWDGHTATVTITRTGLPSSWVTDYTIRVRQTGRLILGPRVTVHRGRFNTPTRYTTWGASLRLFPDSPQEQALDLVVDEPVPYTPADAYDQPPAGSRYVLAHVTASNPDHTRRARVSTVEYRLVMSDGTTAEATYAVNGCVSLDVPAGESRAGCVAFQIPDSAIVRSIEFSGDAETGTWG